MSKFFTVVVRFVVIPLISLVAVLVLILVVTRLVRQHSEANKIAIKSDEGIDSSRKSVSAESINGFKSAAGIERSRCCFFSMAVPVFRRCLSLT